MQKLGAQNVARQSRRFRGFLLTHRERPGPDIQVALFDVFETLLVRRVATPEGRYLLLGHILRDRGLTTLEPEHFTTLRARAERHAAAEHRDDRESQFSLDDLARQLADLAEVPRATARAWCDIEIEQEGQLLTAVPGAAELTQQCRDRGMRIAYVSDMYLPRQQIATWLQREKIATATEPVFVSGETGVCKGTGNLFRLVLSELQVEPRAVEHHGNNTHADLRGARRVGIWPRFRPAGNLNRYERRLSEADGGSWGRMLAGTSRLVRLARDSRADAGLTESAAGVVAPLLVSFVAFILTDAARRGIDRLVFLSRDGELPFQIARRLAPRLGIDLPMSYLLASRRCWSLAALDHFSKASLAWVLEPTEQLTLRSCLSRAHLTPEEAGPTLRRAGFPPSAWDHDLRPPQRHRLAQLLLHDPSMAALLQDKQQEALRALTAYLKQEGVLDCAYLGLVDLGWHGTLQQALRDILDRGQAPRPTPGPTPGPTEITPPDLMGYYVGLTPSNRFKAGPSNRAIGVVRDGYRGVGGQASQTLPQLGFILETLCAADHGSLHRYQEGAHGVSGVFDPDFDPQAGAGVRDTLRRIVLAFTDQIVIDPHLFEEILRVAPAALDNLNTLWHHPTTQEARAWGRFPIDDRKGGSGRQDPGLARPIPWTAPLRALLSGAGAPPLHLPWSAGAMAQTPPATALALKTAMKLRRLAAWRPSAAPPAAPGPGPEPAAIQAPS